jgi:thiol:disulfide interchange protein DsbC
MKKKSSAAGFFLAATMGFLFAACAHADEAQIRKTIGKRIPGLATIDEIRKTPIAGIYEVRIGNEIAYSDATGEYMIRGSIVRTSDRVDVTAERTEELTRVAFNDLPFSGAIVKKTGNGKRKIAIFEDPNCGYCKRLEQDIDGLADTTVYTFLIPLLSQDSTDKSQAIWCAKDKSAAWSGWMLNGKKPEKVDANCPAPLRSNLEFAHKYAINGTPTMFFEDGSRVTGAIPLKDLNAKLAQIYKK